MISEPITITFIIAIAAGAYSAVLRYVMYELGGMRKLMEKNKQLQEEMKEINKKYISAARARRDSELKKYEEKMNKMAGDMLKSQLKPMLITLPLLLVSTFIAGQLREVYSDYVIMFPFSIPIPQFNLEHLISWRDAFGPVGWFWISFMLFSFIAQMKIGGVKNGKTK